MEKGRRIQATVDIVQQRMLTTLAGLRGKRRGDLVREAIERYLSINAWRLSERGKPS